MTVHFLKHLVVVLQSIITRIVCVDRKEIVFVIIVTVNVVISAMVQVVVIHRHQKQKLLQLLITSQFIKNHLQQTVHSRVSVILFLDLVLEFLVCIMDLITLRTVGGYAHMDHHGQQLILVVRMYVVDV